MSDIQNVKDSVSIVEIIGDHVKLSQAGNYFRGLCPFHNEKSPSFHVSEQTGHYKCFGCGETGDVFDFLQKYEGLTLKEALEGLAKKAGITLSKNNYDQNDKQKEKILEILELAASYYQENLEKDPSCQQIRDYVKKRGLLSDTIQLFRLGASKSEWQDLADFLIRKKFTREEIAASGLLVVKDTGRMYDRLRGRLIFPLKNHRGQVVGFSGRIIQGDEKDAKYINTPETLLYHKSKMLYGLHELNREIKKAKEMLIVEGEFDMLSSVQAKVANVCAIKGSALTADHAKLIARYVNKVVLALDADNAGVEATKKAIAMLRPVDVELKVVMIDKGKDPDEYARQDSSAWREKVAQAVSVYDFFLKVILAKYDLKRLEDQKKVLQELAAIFELIDNRLEYEFYLKKLAAALNQEIEVVRQDLIRWKDFGKIKITNLNQIKEKPVTAKKKLTKRDKLEAYLWFLFFQSLSEETNLPGANSYILTAEWQNPFLIKMVEFYRIYQSKVVNKTLKNFVNTLPEDFQEKIAALCLNQTFVKFSLKTDLVQEWANQQLEHEREVSKQKVEKLKIRLTQLEDIEQLSEVLEQERQAILREITTLKTQKVES